MEQFEQAVHRTLPNHFARFIDTEPLEVYEQISDHMHLHLYAWAPTSRRPMWTISTAGMSAHQMNTPPELQKYSRVELVMTLPSDWPAVTELDAISTENAGTYRWPFDALHSTARLPYVYDSWVGRGHTVRCPDTDETYEGSEFSGLLLDAVTSLPPEAMTMDVEGTPVHLLGLYPLYPRELQGILNRELTGHEWFHRCFDAGFYEGLHLNRPVLI